MTIIVQMKFEQFAVVLSSIFAIFVFATVKMPFNNMGSRSFPNGMAELR